MTTNDDLIKISILNDMAQNGMMGKGTMLSYNVLSSHLGGGAISPEKVKALCKEMDKETGSLRQRGQVVADDLSAGLQPKAYDLIQYSRPEDYNTFRSLCKAKFAKKDDGESEKPNTNGFKNGFFATYTAIKVIGVVCGAILAVAGVLKLFNII